MMEKRHIQGLDSLRAIAIIGVILFHMFPAVVQGGYLGVVVFFVLSGYLISVGVLSDVDRGGFNLFRFYIKRIKRIYPPLIVGTILITISAVLFAPDSLTGGAGEIVSIFDGTYNIRQIMMNASYFTKLTNSSPFTHLWSMGVELQFYLIFPLFVFLYIKMEDRLGDRAATVFYAALTILTFIPMLILFHPGQDVSRLYYGTDTRLFSLMMGSLIGVLQRGQARVFQDQDEGRLMTLYERERREKGRLIKRRLLLIPIALVMLFMIVYLGGESQYLYRGGMQLYTVLTAILIIILIKEPDAYGIGYIFDDGPLGWIGRMSYEFYIAMYPIIFIFGYCKLNGHFYSYIIQGILIVIFGMLIHFLAQLKLEKKTSKVNIKAVSMVAVMVICVVIAALNPGNGVAKSRDAARLQKELAENSKLLAEQDKKSASKKAAKTDAGKAKADKSKGTDANKDSDSSKATGSESYDITFVGDSVMLGASKAILNTFSDSYVDAKESRQVRNTLPILQGLANEGKIGSTVVIALGTNGAFTTDTGSQLIDFLGTDKKIYWVKAYGQHLQWQQQANAAVDAIAEKYSNVKVIDWASEGAAHPEYFGSDGIHLNEAGSKAYAKFIKKCMDAK
jgi:peptidoglycan/LPS O-acetylase OafA/YrhL